MREAGFEPAHPEITELKPVALTTPPFTLNNTITLQSQTFHIFTFSVSLYFLLRFLYELHRVRTSHPRPRPLTAPTVSSLALPPHNVYHPVL